MRAGEAREAGGGWGSERGQRRLEKGNGEARGGWGDRDKETV